MRRWPSPSCKGMIASSKRLSADTLPRRLSTWRFKQSAKVILRGAFSSSPSKSASAWRALFSPSVPLESRFRFSSSHHPCNAKGAREHDLRGVGGLLTFADDNCLQAHAPASLSLRSSSQAFPAMMVELITAGAVHNHRDRIVIVATERQDVEPFDDIWESMRSSCHQHKSRLSHSPRGRERRPTRSTRN